jgi:two-component system, sensor histidine kinase and response regulator
VFVVPCYTAVVMAGIPSHAQRFGVATLAIIGGTLLLVVSQYGLGSTPPVVAVFLLAIGFSAWYGGFAPGLLALVLAVPAGDLLTVTLDPNATLRTRSVDAAALVVVGMLTNAMLLYRETQARMQLERRQDAVERRRTADHLTQERHRMHTLLAHSPDRIYFKDRDCRFLLVSPSLVHDFGKQQMEEVLGKSDFDMFTKEHAQAAYDDEQEIMRTGVPIVNKEEKETRPDGRVTWAESTKVPFRDPDGIIIGTFGISRDITERKLADEALREAKIAAEGANLAKSQFLANMSHEIRTPLSAVVGMAEVLLDSGLTPEQREFAEIIHRSGNGLVAMLNDILDFSKIEAGKLELEAIPFDLGLAVDDVVHLLAATAEAKGLELIQRIAPGAPVRLLGDPGRLRQVLSNLIGNAIKFTESGHVFVDVSGEPVDNRSARVLIAVSDTGIGIPREKLGTIFDKFTQADTSTTRRYGGTGLGLAICRQIAENMGGSLQVDSQPDQGSTFTLALTLPIAPGSAAQLPIQIDLSGTHVLVVEANAITRRVIAEQLSTWGCIAHGHARVEDALAETTRCRLAVIDAQLGEASGLDLGKQLRQGLHGPELGLILLTALGQRGEAKLAESAGFNAYLVKPVRSLDLCDALSTIVQAQQFGDLSGLVTRHTLAERRGHSSSDVHRRSHGRVGTDRRPKA